MTASSQAGKPAHDHDLRPWQHGHVFDSGNRSGEARTRVVLGVTLVTMAVEIIAGWWTGSMALLADGWHMGTHAIALGVATWAYAMARRHAGDRRFSFGTWKIEVLGSFASAMVLGMVAAAVLFESAVRLWRAEPIALQSAMTVAVIGLIVNLLSAWLLHGGDAKAGHGHAHHDHHTHGGHNHSHDHSHDHADHAHTHEPAGAPSHAHDMNLRAAYVHVLADAFTSVLAIAALAGAMWLDWHWLDPLVGVFGAIVIGVWAVGLLRESGTVLLDREMDHPLVDTLRQSIESDGDARVADLHVWRVGRNKFAAIVCVVADAPMPPQVYRDRLAQLVQLVHVSIEVNQCPMAH